VKVKYDLQAGADLCCVVEKTASRYIELFVCLKRRGMYVGRVWGQSGDLKYIFDCGYESLS
jgi:hypothetical protein